MVNERRENQVEQIIENDEMKPVHISGTGDVSVVRKAVFFLITGFAIGIGLWEVFFGWAQLLGFRSSPHHLFPVTGSFYNPGPYCLFLAVMIPLALFNAINGRTGFFYWEGIVFLIMATALMPVLMGRTGWIAAFVGGMVTLFGTGHVRIPRRRNLFTLLFLVTIVLSTAGVLLYRLKPASAMGRLFLWKMGLTAMMQDPIRGVGWKHVPGVLGLAQEHYFSQNPDSIFVEVAGCPECAFNEYHQIGIAFGIPALILFVIVLAFAAYSSWTGRQYGITGAIIAFAVGCMGSYPFRFREFLLLMGALMIAGVLAGRMKETKRLCLRIGVSTAIAAVSVIASAEIKNNEKNEKNWNVKRYAYQYSLTETNIHYLDSLMLIQNKNPQFIFDYGKALRESGHYEKSNEVLMTGECVSADPMFLNLMGRNYLDMGNPCMAEQYYRRSIHRLPDRLYPYYLLGLLFADPKYGDDEKFLNNYKKVLTMKPKVMSPAINEMMDELKFLYERMNTKDSKMIESPDLVK